jgi:hypothetical protein
MRRRQYIGQLQMESVNQAGSLSPRGKQFARSLKQEEQNLGEDFHKRNTIRHEETNEQTAPQKVRSPLWLCIQYVVWA